MFFGSRPGESGVGYYKDHVSKASSTSKFQSSEPAAKPTVIGSNKSIIKGLTLKSGMIKKKKKGSSWRQFLCLLCVLSLPQDQSHLGKQVSSSMAVLPSDTALSFLRTTGLLTLERLSAFFVVDTDLEAGAMPSSAYLREMQAWKKQACSSEKGSGSLVK